VHHTDPAPWNVLRGPVHARGGVSGVILRHGEEIAVWGEPDRADLTFSVAKTHLALLAGVAHARGLLRDADEAVVARVPNIGFDSSHSCAITWAHLLEQTYGGNAPIVGPQLGGWAFLSGTSMAAHHVAAAAAYLADAYNVTNSQALEELVRQFLLQVSGVNIVQSP
jgi:subtilisin family serine protease